MARELHSSSTQLAMIICNPGNVTPGCTLEGKARGVFNLTGMILEHKLMPKTEPRVHTEMSSSALECQGKPNTVLFTEAVVVMQE